MNRQKKRSACDPRRLKALFLLGFLLSVLAMAQSARLHHAIHADADEDAHHCAVTLLLSGQVDSPLWMVTPSRLDGSAQQTSFPIPTILIVRAHFSLPPSCGPPLTPA